MSKEKPASREDRLIDKQISLQGKREKGAIPEERFSKKQEKIQKKLDELRMQEKMDRIEDFFQNYPQIDVKALTEQVKNYADLYMFSTCLIDHPKLSQKGVAAINDALSSKSGEEIAETMLNNVDILGKWGSDWPKANEMPPQIKAQLEQHASDMNYLSQKYTSGNGGQELGDQIDIYTLGGTMRIKQLSW
ncbi:hypothetical protein COY32_06775 [candidate division WWE3 bacterium CG_4_10_14_0_2_um_filter_41_14]|uniref:Uncharacterized protein n=1 Tax=candidate division WWE3 bacterium CG_4_10_14_0_2_um_filter_41_14 TaxID=1975072 RepID=A0A2M7TEV5_UNCKA|nr:MAG: hypothetical protein COY32_06775 [candidate division WWE3 bacterium CG_4_10_14_0_2_um_filter_41_14]